MLQKKVCMLGSFGVGKTSMVRRSVHSMFDDAYLSTVGVKIDKKAMDSPEAMTLMLWDIAGRDEHQDINPSFLRGAHACLFVVDGTRRETVDVAISIRADFDEMLRGSACVVAINKGDLTDDWEIGQEDETRLRSLSNSILRCSAKSGDGVKAVFDAIARAALA
ncbi:MAG: Rab family GTPase [Planctomycetota bacterium]